MQVQQHGRISLRLRQPQAVQLLWLAVGLRRQFNPHPACLRWTARRPSCGRWAENPFALFGVERGAAHAHGRYQGQRENKRVLSSSGDSRITTKFAIRELHGEGRGVVLTACPPAAW